jgi:hypothetical protein
MGLEAATIKTIAAFAAAAGGAASLYSAVQGPPKSPSVPSPVAPPQESKTPDVDVFKERNKGRAGSTGAGTMLAGLGGVQPGTLNLGKNTLLGA